MKQTSFARVSRLACVASAWLVFGWLQQSVVVAAAPALRPPAVPLVTHDPYFSIWSAADKLADVNPTHWTGHAHPLRSLVRVDGQTFRLMGVEPAGVPALPQTSLEVFPTRTTCRFTNSAVVISLTFLTPAIPSNLDVLSRPVTYLTWTVQAADGQSHPVQVYFDAGPEIAVNTTDQSVEWSRPVVPGMTVLQLGSVEQSVLGKSGDDLRIDWGSLYVASTAAQQPMAALVSRAAAQSQFMSSGQLPANDDGQQPRPVANDAPVLAMGFDLGEVGATPVSRQLLLGYDDIKSINYFGSSLSAYWRRNGMTMLDLLPVAASEYLTLKTQCAAFDAQLETALTAVGGGRYSRLCVLAYRQTLAGNKIVADVSGKPLMFPKENFSNGCLGTVDVLYPQAPFFLALSPALTRAMLQPILDYAVSYRWKFPFAPHDLGTYPWATGQVYGGGEQTTVNQMPNEETGNMLIMLAALARREGSVDFVAPYWPMLRQWADFLVANGLDPADQLSSADMFGPMPHATDLALKSIIGIGAYGQLCELAGRPEEARHYMGVATGYAAQWQALSADVNHTRLAYDKPGTWSMKHNLIWDRVLGLGLFPDSVGDQEIAWYLSVQNTYGLPVDNRTTTCLIDWAMWSIALARNTNDFEALVAPIFDYVNQTPSRVPMSDWYQTLTSAQQAMQARPVVGGLFIRMITETAAWTNWYHQGESVSGPWAPLPLWGRHADVVPTSENQPVDWRYTMTAPGGEWFETDYNDLGWSQGAAGFGTAGTPGAVVRTSWSTSDIWLRRTFVLNEIPARPRLRMHHDETATVYLNGVLATELAGYTSAYGQFGMLPGAVAALRPGTNVLAVHCSQTGGGQYIDVGLVADPPVLPAVAPVRSNLVAHWPLNVNADELLGRHQGRLIGRTNRAVGPGPLESALYFDGASYVKTGTNYDSLFDGTRPFSGTAWIRGDTNHNDSVIMGKMVQGGAYTGWELHVGTPDLGSGPGKLNVWLINSYGNNFIQVNSPVPVLDGTWHHVALTYDGSRRAGGIRIYVDGQDATGSTGADSLTGSLQNGVEFNLGTRASGAFHNFTGSMCEASLWDVVLTPQNVAHVYQQGLPGGEITLKNSGLTSAGAFEFAWNSLPGTCYEVEQSNNLLDWLPLEAGWPVGGASTSNILYSTMETDAPATFYRVRPVP